MNEVHMEHDPKDGIICPWCSGKVPINKCAHNPFNLMKERDKWKAEFELIREQFKHYQSGAPTYKVLESNCTSGIEGKINEATQEGYSLHTFTAADHEGMSMTGRVTRDTMYTAIMSKQRRPC